MKKKIETATGWRLALPYLLETKLDTVFKRDVLDDKFREMSRLSIFNGAGQKSYTEKRRFRLNDEYIVISYRRDFIRLQFEVDVTVKRKGLLYGRRRWTGEIMTNGNDNDNAICLNIIFNGGRR